MSKSAPMAAAGAAFGAAVATALAQLGLASGLAILIWRETTPDYWASHLSWAAWLAAASTVVGGAIGSRMAQGTAGRVLALPAAALGGFTVAPLIAIPAMRFADAGLSAAPFYATGIGVLAGVAVTAVALASRAVAVNVAASILLTWLLAGLATFVPVGGLDEPIRLGIWGSWRDLVGALGTGAVSLAPPMLLGSLLIGAVTAWAAGRSGDSDSRVVAVSGMAGPVLLIVGYAAAGQPDVGVDPQWSGIWTGLYATVAGLLGSLLVTALRGRPAPAPTEQPVPEPTGVTEPEPVSPAPYLRVDHDENPWAATDRTDPIMPPPPPGPDPEPEPEPATTVTAPKKAGGRATKKTKTPDPVPEPAAADATEDWVTGLKDDDPYGFAETEPAATEPAEPEPKKRKRLGRKKAD
ncbi:hypothetical protein LX16_5206 [Stackebrandtia albiflava]|uniref:Uncharacterized protein n=1 Tax=Stackebrandtia albiflava TaxID=406432 RepID=A0A562ULJ0_9ACTN|nr:hypothetical protein [Stackebrandtia albiflava]TWJ06470.1 hypothetical protein LX16_5206 [Stackebrandtia albiflava]